MSWYWQLPHVCFLQTKVSTLKKFKESFSAAPSVSSSEACSRSVYKSSELYLDHFCFEFEVDALHECNWMDSEQGFFFLMTILQQCIFVCTIRHKVTMTLWFCRSVILLINVNSIFLFFTRFIFSGVFDEKCVSLNIFPFLFCLFLGYLRVLCSFLTLLIMSSFAPLPSSYNLIFWKRNRILDLKCVSESNDLRISIMHAPSSWINLQCF